MNPMSKPRLLFLLLALLATFLACAQNGLGYIVLKEGDTLRGELTVKQGYPNAPRIVGFAGTESAAAQEFSIHDCIAFVIGNNVYQRATVTMDMSYLSSSNDYRILYEDSMLTQTIFLKQVYKGKYFTLLKYFNGDETGFIRQPNIKLHFFINDGEKTQELIMKYSNMPYKDHPFDNELGSRAMRLQRPIYHNQLRMYYDWFKEKKLRKKIEYSEYREDHLVSIIKEIDSKYRPQTN